MADSDFEAFMSQLPADQQQVLQLVRLYDAARSEVYLYQYQTFPDYSPEVLSSRPWKQFMRLRDWFNGRSQSWSDYRMDRLRQYFVWRFRQEFPRKIYPNQMANPVLLEQWARGLPAEKPEPVRNAAEMDKLYRAVFGDETYVEQYPAMARKLY